MHGHVAIQSLIMCQTSQLSLRVFAEIYPTPHEALSLLSAPTKVPTTNRRIMAGVLSFRSRTADPERRHYPFGSV